MLNFDELFENLSEFILELEHLIINNVFDRKYQEEVKNFGIELFKLCQQKQFDIEILDILNLQSFDVLMRKVPKKFQSYVLSRIEWFYDEIIESIKVELY
ncbi:hypothetical protein [Streptococcus sp. zg-JUN1979]|uniref:hypothetical protein n=1 Tax=Streptococcus sp. zg-JUN1979 TaxID=3391450 RepID=UPI0039A5347D